MRAYARVKEGRGLIVAVTGEPGIGKTSLVEDFLAELGRARRAADDRARPMFGEPRRIGSVPADSRGARQPAAPPRRAVAGDR